MEGHSKHYFMVAILTVFFAVPWIIAYYQFQRAELIALKYDFVTDDAIDLTTQKTTLRGLYKNRSADLESSQSYNDIVYSLSADLIDGVTQLDNLLVNATTTDIDTTYWFAQNCQFEPGQEAVAQSTFANWEAEQKANALERKTLMQKLEQKINHANNQLREFAQGQ